MEKRDFDFLDYSLMNQINESLLIRETERLNEQSRRHEASEDRKNAFVCIVFMIVAILLVGLVEGI